MARERYYWEKHYWLSEAAIEKAKAKGCEIIEVAEGFCFVLDPKKK